MGSHDLRLRDVVDDDVEDFAEECRELAARLQAKQYVYLLQPNPKPSVHPGRKHQDGASTSSCRGS